MCPFKLNLNDDFVLDIVGWIVGYISVVEIGEASWWGWTREKSCEQCAIYSFGNCEKWLPRTAKIREENSDTTVALIIRLM